MEIYLPIAELPVDVFLLLALGGVVGFLSGMFGIGGGFLITPLLIFLGIVPPVAVASGAAQLVATSFSGLFAHWRRANVDFKMGAVVLFGGAGGSWLGVWLFERLSAIGQIDLVILLAYIAFMLVVGFLMAVESLGAIVRRYRHRARRKAHSHTWIHGLPLKMRFPKSRLYISALPPMAIGFTMGLMASIMGIGGGFFVIPAMIYLLGMPTALVVGTSLLQITFVAAVAAFFHAGNNQTVDILLVLLLSVGGVVGTQYGARIGLRLRAEYLRGLLAVVVLLVVGRLIYLLVTPPADEFSFTFVGAF